MKNTSYWAQHENGRKIVLKYTMPQGFENCKVANSAENPELKAQYSLIAQAIDAANNVRELNKELKYIRDMTNKLKEVKA